MSHDDSDLVRHNEDLPAAEYAAEEAVDHYDFGNWPEVGGLVLTGIIVWLVFAFTG